MKYYIYKNSIWNEVKVEIEPNFSKAFDTTNDTLSCILKANDEKNAELPMTPFKVVDDDNKNQILWIINDTVDIFSLKPKKYKHTLSVVQYRYFLNKHLIRNTVFNQPRKKRLELYGAVSTSLWEEKNSTEVRLRWVHIQANTTTKTPNYWGDKLALNNHTRIKALSYQIKFFCGLADPLPGDPDEGKWMPLEELNPDYNVEFNEDCYFIIVDKNNADYPVLKINFNNDVFKNTVLDSASLQVINAYISSHRNAYLQVKYWADNAGSSPYDWTTFSFIKTIQEYWDRFDEDENENPELYDAARYRYITAQLYVNLEIYNYTMYDVIETLLIQNTLRSTTQGFKNDILFNLPLPLGSDEDVELYNLLKNTYPADTMSFTQATFYDALTEIFRYYDAGFSFDENKVLKIEYYNNPKDEIELVLTGRKITHSDKNFNNGRVAYYQNALLPIKIPRIKVRCQNLGVPARGDFGILLEKPIYEIDKLYLDVWDSSLIPPLDSNTFGYYFERMKLDITSFVVNSQEYTVLDKANPSNYSNGDDLTIKYQNSVLHFSRGGNFISLSETYTDGGGLVLYTSDLGILKLALCRYFGYGIKNSLAPYNFANPNSGDWFDYVFTIQYLTMNNGRSEIQTTTYKYPGTQIANQNAGVIDINKLGLNILGESLKDGEPVLTGTCNITDWENRIKEGDYWVDNDGNQWVANVVNYIEITEGKYRCVVEFSKNFNALALRVQSDKEKRLTNVSSESAVLSEDNWMDYIYVSTHSFSNSEIADQIILDDIVISSMIKQTFKDVGAYTENIPDLDIRFGLIDTYDMLGNLNTYGSNASGSLEETENRYIPILKYGAGNCICFEMQFKDALSAGNKLTIANGWFGSNRYFSSAALYTDDEGWADRIDISFCDLTTEGEVNDIGNFPVVDSSAIANDDSKYVKVVSKIESLYYYKKPNEIFALNYEWCFLIREQYKNKLFISNKFINNNFFTNKESITPKKFFLRYILETDESTEKYSMLDTKGIGEHITPIISIRLNNADHKISLGFNCELPPGTHYLTVDKWAIVDENNDIYFASNEEATFSDLYSGYQLYFLTSKTRRKDF